MMRRGLVIVTGKQAAQAAHLVVTVGWGRRRQLFHTAHQWGDVQPNRVEEGVPYLGSEPSVDSMPLPYQSRPKTINY